MIRTYTPELLDHVAAALNTYFLTAETEDPRALQTRVIYRVRRRFDPAVVAFESYDFEEASVQHNRLTARAALDAYHEEIDQ
jgi:hypothetical protein